MADVQSTNPVDLIRTIDAHNAAMKMVESLRLNAEVQVTVGKWDERGQITGWSKGGKTAKRAELLVEVFISDIDGEEREWARYRRMYEELQAENRRLRERLAGGAQ